MESPRAAAAVPRIKYPLFELECPAAAVIEQLSSQPAGAGCCSSVEKKSYTTIYSNVPCMVYKYPISYNKVYTFLGLYIQVHRRIYFRGKVYTGIYSSYTFENSIYPHIPGIRPHMTGHGIWGHIPSISRYILFTNFCTEYHTGIYFSEKYTSMTSESYTEYIEV